MLQGEIVRNSCSLRSDILLLLEKYGCTGYMHFNLVGLAAFLLCTSAATQAIGQDDISPATVADQFLDALRHQRFNDAAAMFGRDGTQDAAMTERTLRRIDASLGGFSTVHPIAALPDGDSVKLEVPARKDRAFEIQKFVQVRYVSAASDGQPVFFELDLAADRRPPQILSFGLHFPVADPRSSGRANQLVNIINR